ncbi:hypothetical protein OGATHE_006330 [Ogataea polymorpha]|uniref:Major facilitator superfamily (MFS) profile domain-containing protein n=1 Tax=Ogataea polymorpha TaxID=460523 RepID=A0A9P8SYJ1_9ASCO|nr:hypothetical protein OGATHE_006330 [Ogataea polymorpha]
MIEILADFPLFQVAIVSMVRLVDSIGETSTFPYMYHLVKYVTATSDESKITVYISYLSATGSLFHIIFNLFWGFQADYWGRKNVLLISLIGQAVSLVIIANSTSFTGLLISRVVFAVTNNTLSTIRTILGEIAHEKRHQSLAFSIVPLFYNLGFMIGPFLSSQLINIPSNTDDFGDRPFFTANVVIAALIFLVCVIAFLFLQETHQQIKHNSDLGLALGNSIRSKLGFNERIIKEDPFEIELDDSLLSEQETEPEIELATDPSSEAATKPRNKFGLNSKIVHIIISQCFLMSHILIYSHFLPVFLSAPFQPESLQFPLGLKGGLGMSYKQVGTMLSVGGLVGIIMVLFLSPILEQKFGILRAYRLGVSVFIIAYFVLPLAAFGESKDDTIVSTVLSYISVLLKEIGGVTCFPYIFILLHRATPPESVSFLNGVAMSASGIASFVAPLIGARVLAWSNRNGVATLFWWMLALYAAFSLAHTIALK